MLLLTSFMIVMAYTIYFSKKAHLKKDHIGVGLGKCMVMILSMTTSLTLSLMLSFLMPGKLAGLTVLAIALCAVAGFIIGRPFGLTAVMESLSTTLMGAMMGAMLGVMLPLDSQTFMLVSMDLIYLCSIFIVTFYIKRAGVKETKSGRGVAPFFLTLLFSIIIIGTSAVWERDYYKVGGDSEMDMQHHQHGG
ncbi:hypothetical protein [Peribacillus frigoritolerans]|uniref:hypothetical protein n=1 Tax=Peribacillus frigoritolerans TaxID=450367 RepID=UPI00207A0199|nr:hypothetical protein [Peribacillus frigoritolerans]USK66018.1 hypothetical protein LIT26_05075 [Peribacillus frigoritolerans]